MKFLMREKLSPHKFKTPEGYLICQDAILARTGKQTYRKNELFADAEDDGTEVEVDRPYEEVFAKETLASFENKPVTVEHPDEDVNSENYKSYSVGFVRDIRQAKTDDGEDVIIGNLVIQDADTIEEILNGEHCELSCGYDCDIIGDGDYKQTHIRGNHVALCEKGRAGIAKIIDSVKDDIDIEELEAIEKEVGNTHKVRRSDLDFIFKLIGSKKISISEIEKNYPNIYKYAAGIRDSVKDEDYENSTYVNKDKNYKLDVYQFVEKDRLTGEKMYLTNWNGYKGHLSENGIKMMIKHNNLVKDSVKDEKSNITFVYPGATLYELGFGTKPVKVLKVNKDANNDIYVETKAGVKYWTKSGNFAGYNKYFMTPEEYDRKFKKDSVKDAATFTVPAGATLECMNSAPFGHNVPLVEGRKTLTFEKEMKFISSHELNEYVDVQMRKKYPSHKNSRWSVYNILKYKDSVNDSQIYNVDFMYGPDYVGHVKVRANSEQEALNKTKKWGMNKYDEYIGHEKISKENWTNADVIDSIKDVYNTEDRLKELQAIKRKRPLTEEEEEEYQYCANEVSSREAERRYLNGEDSVKDADYPVWLPKMIQEAKTTDKEKLIEFIYSRTGGYGRNQISWWVEAYQKNNTKDSVKDSIADIRNYLASLGFSLKQEDELKRYCKQFGYSFNEMLTKLYERKKKHPSTRLTVHYEDLLDDIVSANGRTFDSVKDITISGPKRVSYGVPSKYDRTYFTVCQEDGDVVFDNIKTLSEAKAKAKELKRADKREGIDMDYFVEQHYETSDKDYANEIWATHHDSVKDSKKAYKAVINGKHYVVEATDIKDAVKKIHQMTKDDVQTFSFNIHYKNGKVERKKLTGENYHEVVKKLMADPNVDSIDDITMNDSVKDAYAVEVLYEDGSHEGKYRVDYNGKYDSEKILKEFYNKHPQYKDEIFRVQIVMDSVKDDYDPERDGISQKEMNDINNVIGKCRQKRMSKEQIWKELEKSGVIAQRLVRREFAEIMLKDSKTKDATDTYEIEYRSNYGWDEGQKYTATIKANALGEAWEKWKNQVSPGWANYSILHFKIISGNFTMSVVSLFGKSEDVDRDIKANFKYR